MPETPKLVARHLESAITRRLTQDPVVLLNGARTVGKSTLLRGCAQAHGVAVIDLDDLATRQAVAADPALFTQGPEPVCIDEFQHVLLLLDAIKAQLNQDLRPGRYLLTGSTRYATLPATSQSLTGRAHVVQVWPLSQGELRGTGATFLGALLNDPRSLVTASPSSTTRRDYEQMVLTGGFPLALARPSEQSRREWFHDYILSVLTRDVLDVRRVRQRRLLPQVLRRIAAQTAQVLNVAAVANEVGEPVTSVGDYVSLLETVFLIHRLEAYGRTLVARVRSSPKVHLVDSGLGAHLLGITAGKLATRDPSALTEFGHLVETFAVDEVVKQAGWYEKPLAFSHFRTRDVEVDLICEDDDGRIAGVEVKAASRVEDRELNGLRVLRDRLGRAFVGGVVLYLGERSYTREDRIHVLPLDRLWG